MDRLIAAIRERREAALVDATPEEWAQYSGLRELPPMWDPDCRDDEPIEEFDRDYRDFRDHELRHPLDD